MKRLIALLCCCSFSFLLQAQEYKGIVENFYHALGNRNFPAAYQLCSGKNWGTLQQFSGVGMYGGIYGAAISKCEYRKSELPHTIEVLVDVYVKDSVNGNGRFVQNFYLVQQDKQWRIRRIALLQTDRAEKGWNLKLTEQPGLSRKDIQQQLRPVYDTASRLADDGEPVDELERTINTPKFFETPDGIYAVVVVQNSCGECGIAFVGWCDVFVFQQKGRQWMMTDLKLRAGGGGMYGNAGSADKPLLRAGASMVALVITGGQYHMGDMYSFDNVLAIERGRLSDLVSVTTHYDNEGSGRSSGLSCRENSYRFLSSDKQHYDLQVILVNCLGKGKETARIVIPYTGKGYKIPDEYVFEM